MNDPDAPLIFTVGHSTHPISEFVNLLKAHGVTRLVDVRTVPRSRHNPQFNGDALREALAAEGITYEHEAGLGGFRRSTPESPNTGWRNLSFRGYADYMATDEFERSLTHLIDDARRDRIAVMCAEAVPWRCHRSLIADALIARGWHVEEIVDGTGTRAHTLTPFARVNGTRITYPPEAKTSV